MWIARKSLYLWYSEQHNVINFKFCSSCELLAKVCIFDILNNCLPLCRQRESCELLAKVCIFDILNNFVEVKTLNQLLWIARKSLYLWYSEQRYILNDVIYSCCELLAKVCIFDILNNKLPQRLDLQLVVNCSQKFVSLIFWTTSDSKQNSTSVLWIARKSLYLWYSEQL